VIGAMLAVFAAVMRRKLHETEAFEEAKKSPSRPARSPAFEISARAVAGGWPHCRRHRGFLHLHDYMQTFVRLSVGLTADETTYVIFGSLLFATLLQPIYGGLSDRIGRKPLLISWCRRHPFDDTDPDYTEADQVAVDGIPADLRAWVFVAGYTRSTPS